MERGYIHIYTGNGKGKTTAVMGLSLRAVGAGKRVFIGQFVKSMVYHDVKAIREFLPNIEVVLYGNSCMLSREPNEKDIACAKNGLAEVKKKLLAKEYDVVVLDEIMIALFYKLLDLEEVLELLDLKPDETELVLTGRYAPKELIERADLVTDMQEVKHYYQQGVLSRKGIDN